MFQKKASCENWTECLDFRWGEEFSEEDDALYFELEKRAGWHCRNCRADEIREEILRVLERHPLNGMQICRIINGAKGEFDIKFCRSNPGAWRDQNRFKNQGSPYPNCFDCSVLWSSVYYHLRKLEAGGKVESRVEFRGDPIVPHAKDRMRMWALSGRLPNLDEWL